MKSDDSSFRQEPTNEFAQNASLTEQARLFEAALQNMSQGLCMFDADSRLLVSNRRYQEIFNVSTETMARGNTQSDICSALVAQGCYPPSVAATDIVESTRSAMASTDSVPILRELADGRVLSVVYRSMRGGGWISTFEDVTDRIHYQAQIDHLAYHDPLTDLANTRAMRFQYRDLVGIDDPARAMLALHYIDLIHFKYVNDNFGHAAGDKLLQAVAMRLRRNTRDDDIVAHLGGDRFVVIARVADDLGSVAAAHRLVAALSQPYKISGERIEIGAVVGVASRYLNEAIPDLDVDAVLQDADLALRHAKAKRYESVGVFEPGMAEAARARSLAEIELKTALTEQQFEVYYQILMGIRENRIVGAEALVRWRHPTRGLLSPLSFIGVMEATDMIIPLGRWVLEKACRDALKWPGNVTVAVNVSSVQMRDITFGETVLALLEEIGLPPSRLEIEITESAILEESEVTRTNLAVLHDAGVLIAMDDFGTGYSSLGYLRRFPFDKIKIDRSFMVDAECADARAIIRAVAGLGVSLGITTLVEGVETERQLDVARAEGIDQVQGYLFSRPESEAIVTKLILGEGKTNPVPSISYELDIGRDDQPYREFMGALMDPVDTRSGGRPAMSPVSTR